LYVWPTGPGNLEVEPEEEVGADEKGSYILQSEVGRAIKEMRGKKTTRDEDAPVGGFKIWEKMVPE